MRPDRVTKQDKDLEKGMVEALKKKISTAKESSFTSKKSCRYKENRKAFNR